MAPLRRRALAILAVVSSGVGSALLVPPFHAGPLVWVVLIPMLLVLWTSHGKGSARRGFLLGWLTGTVGFLIQLRWLAVVSTLGVVVLPLYLGLFWGIFGWFAATWGNPWRRADAGDAASKAVAFSLRIAFCNAAVWAGLEWLRGWLFTGFGWNGLGIAFHQTPVMAQSADLLGIAGLSMVPVFFQSVLVQTARRLGGGARRVTRVDFFIAAAVVAVLVCYGLLRIDGERKADAVRLRALLVQINIPQDAARVLWEADRVHRAYEEETLAAFARMEAADEARLRAKAGEADEGEIRLIRPDWVLWPESALTGRILRSPEGAWGMWRENADTVARVREAGSFHLFQGSIEIEAALDAQDALQMVPRGKAWNTLAVLSPEEELQMYRKHHLVIFGETIPFVDRIPLLRRIYEQQAGVEFGGSFTPGDSFEPLLVPAGGGVIGVMPSICFEDTVPRVLRGFVRPGPQVVVNVTNDGWFKESAAAAQHFANGRFRAIELRRPMLRCANTGVSAALDSTGSTAHPDTGAAQVLVDGKGSHFTRGSLLVELDVPLQPSFSLYARIGDAGVIGLALVGWAWAGVAARRSRVSPPSAA